MTQSNTQPKPKIYNESGWINATNHAHLIEAFGQLLNKSGHQVLNMVCHAFEPEGFTALWLLSESHFAIHTWPTEGMTYFELSSCSKDKFVAFINHMAEANLESGYFNEPVSPFDAAKYGRTS